MFLVLVMQIARVYKQIEQSRDNPAARDNSFWRGYQARSSRITTSTNRQQQNGGQEESFVRFSSYTLLSSSWLTSIQWQGIFFLYLAICRQRQQLILINAVQCCMPPKVCLAEARRGLGISSKSSRVGELSLAMRLHGKKIALAPEFPFIALPGKP